MYEAKIRSAPGYTGVFRYASDKPLCPLRRIREEYKHPLRKIKQLLADEKQTTPEYGELKRHFGWEFDGMRLHEFYFGNMLNANSPLDQGSSLRAQLAAQFGSYEMWEKDFRATAAMRGIGWAILRYERETGMLFNAWGK